MIRPECWIPFSSFTLDELRLARQMLGSQKVGLARASDAWQCYLQIQGDTPCEVQQAVTILHQFLDFSEYDIVGIGPLKSVYPGESRLLVAS